MTVDENDIRPTVASQGRRLPMGIAIGGVIVAGLCLFLVLDGQRRAASAPAVAVDRTATASLTTPPPLYIPTDYGTAPTAAVFPPPPPPPPPLLNVTPSVTPAPQSQFVRSSGMVSSLPSPPASPPVLAAPLLPIPMTASPIATDNGSAALVIDNTVGASRGPVSTDEDGRAAAQPANESVSRIARPSTTVVQGTLIPAVLETALDSTRPGQLRAIVSRDIAGFDGRRVLIPRGSRLIGSYKADLADGQSRAFVEWSRLVRPDGVTIELESPGADIQGRTGVPGRVNRHFWTRFGSALLQTTLNLGSNAAARSLGGDSPVVVALPGATQNVAATTAPDQVRPTLTVPAGARVSVVVAKDLDFGSGRPR